MRRASLLALSAAAATLWLITGCQPKSPAARLQDEAERFVKLGTALGHSAAKEVDSYYGPKALDERTDAKAPDPGQILAQAKALEVEIGRENDPATAARRKALAAQVAQFVALLETMTSGTKLPFDEEAKRLYGVVTPAMDDAAVKAKLAQLDVLLPGDGSTAFRVAAFVNRYVIPADKRPAVFARALEECRRRTMQHWKLPANEHLDVQWTQDVDSAWHRYLGNGQSVLQVNPVAVAYMGTVLDVACHEGYPGHHAQFLLRDAAAGPAGVPVEDQLVLLRTPASVLREGAADYGVELAFPPAERLAFERDVLFPLAGFPGADADKYLQVHRLITDLAFSVLPTLRDYRDGNLSFNSATFKLSDSLISSPDALLKFVDDYGAYVVGYTVVRDQIRDYVQKTSARTGKDPWTVLGEAVVQPDMSFLYVTGGEPSGG